MVKEDFLLSISYHYISRVCDARVRAKTALRKKSTVQTTVGRKIGSWLRVNGLSVILITLDCYFYNSLKVDNQEYFMPKLQGYSVKNCYLCSADFYKPITKT